MMERLTKQSDRIPNRYVSAIGSGYGCWGKIIARLAAYENTGLEPWQIDVMVGHNTALIEQLADVEQELAALKEALHEA